MVVDMPGEMPSITDVIIEPVTKLSFAGQNIHYNFIAVDGADNVSTARMIRT